MPSKKVIVIDGNLLIHKSQHVFRSLRVQNDTGTIDTGIAYGFIRAIMRLNKIYPKCEMAAVFDNSMNVTSPSKGETKSLREQVLPEYKADRTHNDDLIDGVRLLFRFLKTLPINILYPSALYEADDVIAYLVTRAFHDHVLSGSKGKYEVFIVSEDKDFNQLICVHDGFSVKIHKAKDKVWDVKKFRKKFGFSPDRFVSYLALLGDKGDNIHGVHGYGKVKAAAMAKNYRPEEIPDRLTEDEVATFLTNVTLIELVSDPEVVSKVYSPTLDRDKFNELAKKYKMTSFLREEEQEILNKINGLSFLEGKMK
jgi:5'-3' exonuclease